MNLTEKQSEVLKRYKRLKSRKILLTGAVRSGKTILSVLIFLIKLSELKNLGKNVIISGRTVGSVRRNVIYEIERVTGIKITVSNYNSFELYGNYVHIISAHTRNEWKKVSGMTAIAWYANELSEHTFECIEKIEDRISEKNSFIIWDTNPSGKNTELYEKIMNDKELQVENFTIFENEFLDENYRRDVINRYVNNEVMYKRFVLGEWFTAKNAIITKWERREKFREAERNNYEILCGLDFGRGLSTYALIIVAIDVISKVLIIVDEIYDVYSNREMIIKTIKKFEKWNLPMWTQIYADHEPERIREFINENFNVKKAKKGVFWGIEAMLSFEIKVCENCVNFIKEIEAWEWKNGEPTRCNDHLIDALRYAVATKENDIKRRTGRFVVDKRDDFIGMKYDDLNLID